MKKIKKVVIYLECPCEEKRHAVDLDIPVWAYIYTTIQKLGETISISLAGGKTYAVPRIYIAIHGLKGKDLSNLGFKEVKE